jgi:hypothetical protein
MQFINQPAAAQCRPVAADHGPCCCPTRAFLSLRPADLTTWSQAAAATQRTPYPMSERNLRHVAKRAGLRTYPAPRVRGRGGRPPQELVSLTAVMELHRDIHRGWHPVIPPPRGKG